MTKTKTIEHDPNETPKAPPPPARDTPPAPEIPDNPETGLADVAENHPGYVYKPQQGVVSTDVLEVALMMVFQMIVPNVPIAPGALRAQVMQAERFHLLSPEAQRHMRPLVQEVPTS